jgi:hypothetical protein
MWENSCSFSARTAALLDASAIFRRDLSRKSFNDDSLGWDHPRSGWFQRFLAEWVRMEITEYPPSAIKITQLKREMQPKQQGCYLCSGEFNSEC